MRHFLRLYLFLIIAMMLAGWGVEQLWQKVARENPENDPNTQDLITIIESHLSNLPKSQWTSEIDRYSRLLANDVMVLAADEIVGGILLDKLNNNEIVTMRSAERRWWTLKKIPNSDTVLALSSPVISNSRSWFEWLLSLILYAAIALAVMLWVWPLSRDISKLQKATTNFGKPNLGRPSWKFSPLVKPSSQVYQLAESFRVMAHRIDRLIQSHKDISNAVSHEINTPLARMKFEIEAAIETMQNWDNVNIKAAKQSLENIRDDIQQINDLVSATLKYAILDRTDFEPNWGSHNFDELLPALLEQFIKQNNCALNIDYKIQPPASHVVCDFYLMETALKNLLSNALRYASTRIFLNFEELEGCYRLSIEDDGPGIALEDRDKVFNSFTQLKQSSAKKGKFGLGLAIVKRVMEWHRGNATIDGSDLGGAKFTLIWPMSLNERVQ